MRDLIGPLALRSVERALSPVTQMAVHYLLHGAVRHRLHDRVAAARV